MDAKGIIRRTEDILRSDYQININEADAKQLHRALSDAVMYAVADDWRRSRRNRETGRRAYYLSAEYLTGRMIFNNLFVLNLLPEVSRLLALRGVDINIMESIEDCALGNGGLGRLAACFLDSAATHDLPLDGYGIRYKFGLFKQSFLNGFQVERADDWQKQGDPWSRRRDDKTIVVEFADRRVLAVPYDMPVIGFNTSTIGTLRLFQSEAEEEFDFAAFNSQEYALSVREKNAVEDITRVLYPNDSTYEGKRLRLKQQYFFVSASVQRAVDRYKSMHNGDVRKLYEKVTFQLNDTHPTVAVAELMRILMDENGLEWDEAWDITTKTVAYTNHTIMAEALEKWPIELFSRLLPRIYQIVEEINRRFVEEIKAKYPGDQEKVRKMAVIYDGQVKMAHLAICAGYSVNGVAKLHTEILEKQELKDFYEMMPEKFNNKTNGITFRRWLLHCNHELTAWLDEKIGPDYRKDATKLEKLLDYVNDEETLKSLLVVKQKKKEDLAAYLKETQGLEINPNSIFDIQVKRLHEYKRQLLNILHVMYLYNQIKEHPEMSFYPRTFIFGAKASAGYVRAKEIIKLINSVADVVNNDLSINGKLKVVFIEDYRVSNAEWIFAAADVSEQISTASKEASGTGNMKFMLNGAPTLGTMDGANVEIVEEVGIENAFIFGLSSDEVINYENNGGYNPQEIYFNDWDIKRVVDQLMDGTYSHGDHEMFRDLYNSLLNTQGGDRPDRYFILKDFRSYAEAQKKVEEAYKDPDRWAKMALLNTASCGKFTSDRTIQEYVDNIWKLDYVTVKPEA